jgi:voltage-gated potassium channel
MRIWFFRQLYPPAWTGTGLSPLNTILLLVVLISIVAAILQSEPVVHTAFPTVFRVLTLVFAILFSVEYVVRLWAMAEDARYAGAIGRLRYAVTLSSVLDLAATGALWLDILVGIPGVHGVLLRLVRALRVISLTRHSAIATAYRLLWHAVRDRSMELLLSLMLALGVLVVSATVLYFAEGNAQPDTFGSIPRAMWWAVATLTTVDYGDVYPVTAIGKVFASICALTSIAIVAMPTGIMAAAFSDVFQGIRRDRHHDVPAPGNVPSPVHPATHPATPPPD